MTPYLTKLMVNAAIPPSVPPGTLIHYAGRTVPSGWLIANGANVSRKAYAALFAAIGTTYGAGDGSTTFGLPDLNNRFLEGTTSTSEVGTYKEAGLPNITGSVTPGYGVVKSADGCFYASSVWNYYITIEKNGRNANDKTNMSASRSNSLYGAASTVQPSSMASLVLIKF